MLPTIFIVVLGLVVLVFSIILHEVAHGWVADKLGDPTPRMSGRLTLNPVSHIDPLMSIMLPLFLIIAGSPIVFGSAKPVPIDPFNLRDRRKDMGIIGLAGPVTNILIALTAALLSKLFLLYILPLFPYPSVALLTPILALIATYNLLLAAINLIPIPPLDGSRIVAAVLPEGIAKFFDTIEPFGLFILLFLLFFPLGGFSLSSFIFNIVTFWLKLLGFLS